MRKNETPEDLAVYNLHVLYDVESVLAKAIPKMMKAASDITLRTGFETHLAQTNGQLKRLEQIFSIHNRKPRKIKSEGIRAIIADSQTLIENLEDEVLIDATLASAARVIEHYEMALYSGAITDAKNLGLTDVEELLQKNLEEEEVMDGALAIWVENNPPTLYPQKI